MKTFKIENEPKVKSGFIVPENYFEDFSARVMKHLPENEPKVISIFSIKRTWIYAAAAVIVIAISIPFYYQLKQSSKIDNATLENYITNNSTISDADLISLLDEKDIQEMSVNLNLEDKVIENELTTNSDLEHYLLN